MQDLKESPYTLVKEKRKSHAKQAEAKTDLVSVITPSYNCARFIEETIRSVQAQTWQNWEMIIVDDCSTDNSVEVIQNLAKTDTRIRLIEHQWNGGPAVARNIAIEHASGRYIALLDSDDLWLPEKLEKQIALFKSNDAALIVYSSYQKIEENGSPRGIVNVPNKLNRNDLLNTTSIPCLTAIYDTERTGGKVYMKLMGHEDYILWLNILRKGNAYGLSECLAKYRVVKGSVSFNKVKVALFQWGIYRRQLDLNFLQSLKLMFYYFVEGFKKFRK